MEEKEKEKFTIEKSEKEDKISRFDSIREISREIKSNNRYKDDEDIFVNSNLSLTNMKKDLLLFKDEILKDLKRQQSKMFEKDLDIEKNTISKLEEFNKQIDKYSEKINSLSNMIITDKRIREKVEMLIEFKNKNQEVIMTNGIKIKNLDKDLYDNIYRIDSILKETVLDARIIGGISKFQTFHDLMDYILSECSKNLTFREKTPIEVNNLRNNDERIIKILTNKLEKSKKTLNLQIDTFNKKFENKINSLNESFNERIANYRIENMTYSENIKKATESLTKQINSVIQAKNDIINKFDEKMNIINKDNLRMKKYFTEYKNEFGEMRRIFKEMTEIMNSKGIKNFNLNTDFNVKIKKLQRRQTMINKDIKSFEDKMSKTNNILHSINMNDMFMNPSKISFNDINDNNIQKENKSPPEKILRAFKRINTASIRINKFFEKENTFIERQKKNEEIKKTKKQNQKHQKKIKFLNEIYLVYNTPHNIDIIKRKLTKFNSICVPNKKLRINLNGALFGLNANLVPKTIRISNNRNIRTRKKINLISESIYDTSVSKSQNSLFSNTSSEKSQEKRKITIKDKYTKNLIIEEAKEFNLSNTLDKDIKVKSKIDFEKKGFKEEEDKDFDIPKLENSNIDIHKNKTKFKIKKAILENITEKEKKNFTNIVEINKGQSYSNSLNKIYITIEGSNQLEINPNSLQTDPNKKDIVNNIKIIKDNKTRTTLSGYPKIVTNNGESVIYSTRPVFQRNKFTNYTNPNVLALSHSIYNLYESKKQMNKKKNIKGMFTDSIFENKQLISKLKMPSECKTERGKKVSFNIFKSSTMNNNLYLSQKRKIDEYNDK